MINIKEIPVKEAIKIINEWGVNCDDFVAHNYRQFLVDGDPTDNSIDLSEYFLKCLEIVCGLGIKSHNQSLEPTT
jgi:hypothetical protein